MISFVVFPDSKVHGAYMGPTGPRWGRQDPGGPNVSPMILVIWVVLLEVLVLQNIYEDIVNVEKVPIIKFCVDYVLRKHRTHSYDEPFISLSHTDIYIYTTQW